MSFPKFISSEVCRCPFRLGLMRPPESGGVATRYSIRPLRGREQYSFQLLCETLPMVNCRVSEASK